MNTSLSSSLLPILPVTIAVPVFLWKLKVNISKLCLFSLTSESAHTNFLLLFLSNFSCADYRLVHIYRKGHTDLATEELIAQEVDLLGYGFANSHDTRAS